MIYETPELLHKSAGSHSGFVLQILSGLLLSGRLEKAKRENWDPTAELADYRGTLRELQDVAESDMYRGR